MADNPSRSLHKISEIYDRIAFAGVGKYNEFDQLRVSGIRHADTKGYAYSREDVDARSLANLYAQYLGQVFTHEMKPLEVEILVAELGTGPRPDQLYHIAYEGTITDEDRYAVLGGETETIAERLEERVDEGLGPGRRRSRPPCAALAGPDRTLGPADLEVAVLAAGQRPAGLPPPGATTSWRPCWAEPHRVLADAAGAGSRCGPSSRYREGDGQAHLRPGERVRGHLHAARASDA